MELSNKHVPIRYEIYNGALSDEHVAALVPLRLETFYEYPYLYVGSYEPECKYWKGLPAESTIAVFAYDNDMLIGVILAHAEDAREHQLIVHHEGYQEGRCLHIDLTMVAPAYRGRGIARELLRRFEEAARARGYVGVYFITVVRSTNHPLKPEHALDLDAVWSKLGATPLGLYEARNWPTRCGTPGNECVAPIDNMVHYWHKKL